MRDRPVKRRILWGIATLVLVAAGSFLVFTMKPWERWAGAAGDSRAAADSPAKGPRERVELPPGKIEAAKLRAVSVGTQPLQQVRTVPGKIDYNGVQRVELKAPVDSIVQKVLVKPGDAVAPGTRLAQLDSPEIGLVRADVERNRAELAIAQQAREWSEDVTRNLEDLLKFLDGKRKPQQVEKQFEDKILGDHRQHVLGAYAKYLFAEELWTSTQPLADKGSISLAVVKQRESNRDVAREEFRGVAEQSRFDAVQQRDKARSARKYAEQVLQVSQQKLQTLLGAFSQLVEVPPAAGAGDGRELTRFYLISPIAATVQQRFIADAQRVAAGTLLYVVANTDTLWVTADIRERDWQALTLREGQTITVRIPALGDREFEARVNYIGGAVSPETLAIPLIADLANPEHLLKPGLFAWVSLPLGPANKALVVPASALLTHEGKHFVFIEDGPGAFRRRDVTTGVEMRQWVAITHGLQGTERVIDRGAFLLKSELLLEAQE